MTDRMNLFIDVAYEFCVDQLRALTLGAPRVISTTPKIYERMLGQLLYEAPAIPTGFVSVQLLKQKLECWDTRPCQDHFMSRQRGGERLVQMIIYANQTSGTITRDDVGEWARTHCQVHYITREENTALRKHQMQCSSAAAYRRCGINLIYAPDVFVRIPRSKLVDTQEKLRAKYQPMLEPAPQVEVTYYAWPDLIR